MWECVVIKVFCNPIKRTALLAAAQHPVIRLSESQLPLLPITLHSKQQVLKSASEKKLVSLLGLTEEQPYLQRNMMICMHVPAGKQK